jgi:hypothetical protein
LFVIDQEGRAEEAEHHKQEQLKKQEQGKGQWVDELASDSESAVGLILLIANPTADSTSSDILPQLPFVRSWVMMCPRSDLERLVVACSSIIEF